jgi:hypothetical protein
MPETYRVGVAGLIHDHVWGMLRWWKELSAPSSWPLPT